MITPPFVIGLALIMLFGRSGAVNALLEWAFGIGPSRWIYGLPGVWLAQTLALTPVAYLVLVGVVDGISPSLEEAAQTLRASPLDDVHHGHAAADGAGTRQRVPDRVHRKPRRLRQSAAAGRQSRSPVGRHLFRDRRRAAGSRPRGDPRDRAARPVADAVRAPAAAARATRLRHDFRQRGGRAAPAAAARGGGHRRRSRRALGRCSPSSSTR